VQAPLNVFFAWRRLTSHAQTHKLHKTLSMFLSPCLHGCLQMHTLTCLHKNAKKCQTKQATHVHVLSACMWFFEVCIHWYSLRVPLRVQATDIPPSAHIASVCIDHTCTRLHPCVHTRVCPHKQTSTDKSAHETQEQFARITKQNM
jgi:hypothetical protein